MKLFAPAYYKDFKCIKDKCKNSCCVGWEINIDDDTLRRYEAKSDEEILKSISREGGVAHFCLGERDRCPHLTDSGLCKIILHHGEEYLSEICREHPRFYNITPRGAFVGVGASCEEAARLILGCENYRDLAEVGELEGALDPKKFDTAPMRERIYALLSDKKMPYGARIERIKQEFDLTLDFHSTDKWRELLSSLEYLHPENRELFMNYRSERPSDFSHGTEAERFFAYLVYRHTASCENREEFSFALGFALFCEQLLVSLLAQGKDRPENLIRIISEELEYSEDNTEAIMIEFAINM